MNYGWVCLASWSVAVASVAWICGCGTTATITRKSGPPVEATIVAADHENVYVGGAFQAQPVPKDDIVDIDHPGDGAIVAGMIVGTYGIINIGVGAEECGSQSNGAEGTGYCIGVYAPAALGVALLGYGLIVHSESESGLETRPKRDAWGRDRRAGIDISLSPWVAMGPDGGGLGMAALSGSF